METTDNKHRIDLFLSYDNDENIEVYMDDDSKKQTIREFIDGIIYVLNHPVDEDGNTVEIPDEEKIKPLDKNGEPIEYYLTKEEDGDVIKIEETNDDGEILHVSDFNFNEGDHIKLQTRLIPG